MTLDIALSVIPFSSSTENLIIRSSKTKESEGFPKAIFVWSSREAIWDTVRYSWGTILLSTWSMTSAYFFLLFQIKLVSLTSLAWINLFNLYLHCILSTFSKGCSYLWGIDSTFYQARQKLSLIPPKIRRLGLAYFMTDFANLSD